ncbi:hypothetical protein FGO68_gene13435 [Halteria grandinella]|uniref:Uncharacterized protein n=1 Tax=Halteria grandinella TaxID=5974 RepID=A0A8J8TA20_HALGN|nr:hypothetical protein FGO68_gene13435 [Halteria grandinella]
MFLQKTLRLRQESASILLRAFSSANNKSNKEGKKEKEAPQESKESQPKPKVLNPMKKTFHVAMLLFGPGSTYRIAGTEQFGKELEKHEQLGTNLMEATALRIALARHKIQCKNYSIDGWYPQTIEEGQDPKEDQSLESKDEGEKQVKQIESDQRNLLTESARLTRGAKTISELSKLKVGSFEALIIPSFVDPYSKHVVADLYNIPLLRSLIKEFNLTSRYLVPVGASAINLVGKCLELQLRTSHPPHSTYKFKQQFNDERKILSLPYDSKLLNTNHQALGQLNDSIDNLVVSLKSRVLLGAKKEQPNQ